MKVTEAVRRRQSVRAFLDTPVSPDQIRELLDNARWSPSGGNLQPWHTYVLTGDKLRDFKQIIKQKSASQPMGESTEYEVYPKDLQSPYRDRRFKCGQDLYDSIEIPRSDRSARLRQFANNYCFFGAPAALFFAIDRNMQQGQWADLGMFMQTFMLLAIEAGLDTCAQEAWAVWHKTVGEFLHIPSHLMLFCGMSLGYRDPDHPINNWRTERAELSEFVEWHDASN